MTGYRLKLQERCGCGDSEMLTGTLGDEQIYSVVLWDCCSSHQRSVIHCCDLLVSGSSGIPLVVTPCVFVSATSADSVGQFRLPLVYSFGLQHAAIRAFPDHSVSSCALQPYWLDSAYTPHSYSDRSCSPASPSKTKHQLTAEFGVG